MASKDRSVISDNSASEPTSAWSPGVSQNTYLFVYILSMVLSSVIFIRYW